MRRIIFFSLFFLSVVLVKAQSEYSKLIEKGSESYSAGNYNNAAISFEKALSISEQNNNIDTALYYYVGLSHYLAKNYTPAINFFNKSILFNFEKEKALSFKADCFSNLNDIENQEQTLKIGFKLFPNSENILLGLINLYLSQSRYDDALKFLDIATSKSPNNAVLFFAKGAIFEKLNNRNLVYENYLKAITIVGAVKQLVQNKI